MYQTPLVCEITTQTTTTTETTLTEQLWDENSCSCVTYMRSFPEFKDMPRINSPADLKPNTSPAKGVAVLLNWNGLPHIGYVGYLFPGGVYMYHQYLSDGECIVAEDLVEWKEERWELRGYYKYDK